MAQISHVVPTFPLVLAQCFAMVVTVRAAGTQVEVSLKESDLVALDFLRSNSSLKSPCLRYSRTEWFQESI